MWVRWGCVLKCLWNIRRNNFVLAETVPYLPRSVNIDTFQHSVLVHVPPALTFINSEVRQHSAYVYQFLLTVNSCYFSKQHKAVYPCNTKYAHHEIRIVFLNTFYSSTVIMEAPRASKAYQNFDTWCTASCARRRSSVYGFRVVMKILPHELLFLSLTLEFSMWVVAFFLSALVCDIYIIISNLSDERSKASSKRIPPLNAI
jgi:hypothetical protein